MKKYLLVREIPGPAKYEGVMLDAGSFLDEFAARGFVPSGTANSRNPHLDGEPTFADLVGPLGDGERDGVPVVRYESPEVARLLSVD